MTCKHCGAKLHTEPGYPTLIDPTGGDVCPVASLDPNENRPHEVKDKGKLS